MKQISHNTLFTVFSVVYLGMITNVLLFVACLPVVALLMTTDPARSWPLIALLTPLSAPGVCAACAVFAAHRRGEHGVAWAFLRGWRTSWRKAMIFGAIMTSVLTVVLVDIRVLAALEVGVVLVPVLIVLALLAAMTSIVGLVALAEHPDGRVRDILRIAVLVGVRRWYFSLVSLLVVALQFWVFFQVPLVGLGITAAPALHLIWANTRFCLDAVTGNSVPDTSVSQETTTVTPAVQKAAAR